MKSCWILGGVRTPFAKAGTSLSQYSMQELGAHTLRELPATVGVSASDIDEVYYSAVLLDPRTPNWSREMVFMADYPKDTYAHSLSNNCISGLVSLNQGMERVAQGRAEVVAVGGAESMSNPPLLFSKEASKKFMSLSKARTFGDRLSALAKFGLKDIKPDAPSVKEPSTGLTMGQHMEITAKEMAIERALQDELAFKSHQNAVAGVELHADDISPIGNVSSDSLVRADTTLDKLASLRPVFDRSEKGSLTAGNSSPLTDGASALLIGTEERAKELGVEPLAFIRDIEFSAIDPDEGLLMAPGVCVPRLLKRQGLTLEDFDLVEVHEAFAAQVLANVKAWEEGWKEDPVGKIDPDKLNVFGGSIALGHPFAATGGRIVLRMAKALHERDLKRALISVCAAGATACAVILER